MPIENAIKTIKDADAILIFSGSGMSADSGLPIFRGENGFWSSYPDLKNKEITFEDIANPQSFKETPELALGFYGSRLNSYLDVAPHDGYRMLLEICNSKKKGYSAITSNVDGHFNKSGFKNVYAIHGDINFWQCTSWNCSKEHDLLPAPTIHVHDETTKAANLEDLKCPNCKKHYIRPNVLMFSDFDFISRRANQQASIYTNFVNDLEDNDCRVAILEIGAGSALPSIRIMAHKAAIKFHTQVIRINPENECDPTVNLIQTNALDGIELIYNRLCAQ